MMSKRDKPEAEFWASEFFALRLVYEFVAVSVVVVVVVVAVVWA